MNIGVFLTIEAYSLEHNSIEKYRCKIIDKNSKYIYIDYPVHMKSKRTTASFRVGTKMTVEYLGKDQSVYRFKTEVKERKKGRIPTLALLIPDRDQVERIQRRQFVRIETAIDVAIHSQNNKFEPFTTVTVDVSGGGISIIVPKGIHLMDGEKININLVFLMHTGEYYYLELSGEIVRFIENQMAANTASIKFVSLNEQDKQIIIRYCFEKQREARQKELQ